MGSAPLKPSIRVGQLLRSRRKEMGLTLNDVTERTAERGERIPASTLARIEQGKLDPGVLRLCLLLRLYDVPPEVVASLADLELMTAKPPKGKQLNKLIEDGTDHWKAGRIGEGLAHLMAVRERASDSDEDQLREQQATLTYATIARDLGKTALANQLIDGLLCAPPHDSLVARTLVLASSLWRARGSVIVSRALVREAEDHVEGGTKEAAWVRHQQASSLLASGQPDAAEQALDSSLRTYRKIKDFYGQAQALCLRARIREDRKDLSGVKRDLKQAAELATEHGFDAIQSAVDLQLGRSMLAAGDVGDAIPRLRDALARSVLLEDRHGQFLSHYYLWKAYYSDKDKDRARFEKNAAEYFVEFVDRAIPEAVDIKKTV